MAAVSCWKLHCCHLPTWKLKIDQPCCLVKRLWLRCRSSKHLALIHRMTLGQLRSSWWMSSFRLKSLEKLHYSVSKAGLRNRWKSQERWKIRHRCTKLGLMHSQIGSVVTPSRKLRNYLKVLRRPSVPKWTDLSYPLAVHCQTSSVRYKGDWRPTKKLSYCLSSEVLRSMGMIQDYRRMVSLPQTCSSYQKQAAATL